MDNNKQIITATETQPTEIPLNEVKYITTSYLNTVVWSQMKGMAATFIESRALPDYYDNVAKVVMALQIGLEQGMKPMEAINSLYPVNGTFNIWGKAVTKALRRHGWDIKYVDEKDQCTATVTRGREKYTVTYKFEDAVASGYTKAKDKYTGAETLKVGWREGQNRKMKLKYGALREIINSYIPEVLDGVGDIQEVAEDYQPVTEERKAEIDETKKVMRSSSLTEVLAKKKQEIAEKKNKEQVTKLSDIDKTTKAQEKKIIDADNLVSDKEVA